MKNELIRVYNLRTNLHFTLDFVACYNPKSRHDRKESECFKSFTYDERTKRDKVHDIVIEDEVLENQRICPHPRSSPPTSNPPWNNSQPLRKT